MRVLQIHNFYRIRGGECSVVQSERILLKDKGHNVLTYYRDSRDIDGWGMSAKVRMLFRAPYSKVVENDLAVFVRKHKPDIAHVHNVFPLLTPAVYRALRDCGVPVVQTVHNFRFLCPNGQFYIHDHICEACQEHGYFSAVRKRCMQDSVVVSWAYAAAIERAWKCGIIPDYICSYIVLNHFFAERLIRSGVPRSRIHVLGNFATDTLEAVPTKKDYVLYFGRLSREKGIRTLLDAWERIEGAVLKIAGSGPLAKEVEERAARMGGQRIQVLGHVTGDEKRDLIQGALCLVVPSEWYENFPISVVEAMSCGTPIVASRIGGLPELVSDGVTGLLYDSGDSIKLEALLRKMISDRGLARRLACNALVAARDEYGPQKHYDGLIEIYTRAIGSAAGTASDLQG